jgi:hypothetical protein
MERGSGATADVVTEGNARGLYLCGDHCRSHLGVVFVEAAVTSGLLAA